MSNDCFPDLSVLETEFCMNYSYSSPIDDFDAGELSRLVSEGYLHVDHATGWAILTERGWDWCRHERGRNRDGGDSFSGMMPLYMSKADFAAKVDLSIEAVEKACSGPIALATNAIGFVDYYLATLMLDLGHPYGYFTAPADAYPRPESISDEMHRPGGWVYVSNVRPIFRQHDLQIEIASLDRPDRQRGYVSHGLIYGPRGHIAEIPLDDDGMTMMPWQTAAAILRDHAQVELTKEMLTAAWPDESDWRAFRM